MSGGTHVHWNEVYATKSADRVSWFQPRAEMSMHMIADSGATRNSAIIDIGAGASVLVDELLGARFADITVLDIAEHALVGSKQRLAARAAEVHWIVADILEWSPARTYDVWHDRAVFHFLTEERDRAVYRATLLKGLRRGGALIIGTFAEDGPEKCSGLPVHRWSSDALADELGADFRRVKSRRQEHSTPSGTVQPFTWARFERL